ncbi:MAG: MBL fold metallo-hydrolase, partial [Myxococcota bacterium]
ACIGNDKERRNPAWHRLQTPFLERLAEAGAGPDDVDVVLCTHLHFDHVGWFTRWTGERWAPTFPRARYLVARREWEHWLPLPKHAYVVADSLQPVADAGLVDLVEPPCAVTDQVSLEPAPGHTPGHVVVRVRSGGAEAVITGDSLHHPCQVGRPDWSSKADVDADVAGDTRRRLVDDAAARRVLLVGTHFAEPAAGFVDGPPDARRLNPSG